MVNIDTRLLKVADANEVFWLLCIANRIGKDLTCFPSLATQMQDTGWGKPKVIAVRESCEKKGFISVKKRFDAQKNCQTSNVYKIKTPFLSVFVNLKEKGDTELGSNEIIQGGSMKKVERVVTKSYRGSNEIIQPLYENVTLSINQSKLLINEVLEKETPSLFSENDSTNTTPLLDAQTKPKTTVSAVVRTNKENKYRLIETRDELIKVTEAVIRENAEGLKMDYERKGFQIANARDYAIEFATQFFKDTEKCSLNDSKIKDKLCGWSYIFGKVNAEIATAQKAANFNLPFAERQAKDVAAAQEVKQSNRQLTPLEKRLNEMRRIAFEESKK
jgi:hypothetical protein